MSSRPQAHAHRLVVETARGMAEALYEKLMSDNDLYSKWRDGNPGVGARRLQARFIDRNYPKLIEGARTILAGMLGNPLLDPAQAESIYDALVLDATLRRGRGAGHLLRGEFH